MPKIQISEVFEPLLTIRKRFKILVGGRGSGKSLTIADALLMHVSNGAKVGCFREYQNSLAESSYAVFKSEIDRLQLSGFTFTKTEIRHESGGRITFHGLARSLDAIKSMQGYNFFWTEEAQFLSEESIRILTPTIREEGSELWMSANPMASNDAFSTKFITPFQIELNKKGYFEDDMHVVIFANYDTNPWFPEVLRQEMEHDKSIMSTAMWDHVWRGAFLDDIEDAIISAEWFDACIDAHLKIPFQINGAEFVSHDPDSGRILRVVKGMLRGLYIVTAL